jgi:hypothetical protein
MVGSSLSERARVPMAFIGGPLNLKPFGEELLNLTEYFVEESNINKRSAYINTTFHFPNRPNESFIFFVHQSVSFDQAAVIIKTNFSK